MARPLPISHSPARSTPSPPLHQPTNTLAVTSLPKSFFDPRILNMLRNHFDSFGSINQWVPLPGFGRVIIVFEDEQCAELAKLKSDPIVLQGSPDHAEITLRVFRADPNPLVPYGQGDSTWIPHGNYLQPPAIEKNFLISPPGSPPVGWEQIVEDPPNASPLADDLISALRRLQTCDATPKSKHEQLLDPVETGGVGVYLEDYDAGVKIEIEEEEVEWVYGETNPTRDRWRQFATAMPPAPMMRS